ncbi:hypothetical protein [Nonomuraea dietziae]|uniref:hypothetical protein n=1 Tax=Nonomuraea dietziae TaxID=65515 RepID=UPI0031D9FFA0
MDKLIRGIRAVVAERLDPRHTAFAVADLLRADMPGPDLLTPEERRGRPDATSPPCVTRRRTSRS